MYGSVAGLFRFFLDAFLVVLYGFMLIIYDKLDLLVILLSFVFILYTIWDFLKLIEYRSEPFNFEIRYNPNSTVILKTINIIIQINDSLPARDIWEVIKKRRSGLYLIPVGLITIFQISNFLEPAGEIKNILTIIAMLITTIIYRIHKVDWTFRGEQERIERVTDDENTD